MSSYGNYALHADTPDCGNAVSSPGMFSSILDETEALHPMIFDCFEDSDCIKEEQEWSYAATISGDYYRAPDDVTRGVTMNADIDLWPGQDDIATLGASYWDTKCIAPKSVAGWTESFDEGDYPPEAPKDPFFEFLASTLFLVSDSPHHIGNRLLGFLRTQCASVKKFRLNKYAITADISVLDVGECTLKVRVYTHEGQYAVEFQRRKGDAVAFAQVYGAASKFMFSIFNEVA